jgi:uncharacterized protein (DUF362 family)
VRLSRRVLFWVLVALPLLARLGQAISLRPAIANEVSATVANVKCDSVVPNDREVETMVLQAFEMATGSEVLIQPGDTVVIKPNLVLDVAAETGIVTDPRVVRTLVRIARGMGASQVYIAEGSARYSSGDPNRDRYVTRHAFQTAGFDLDGDMVDDVTGVPLVDLNISGETTDARDPECVTLVNVTTGLIRKQYWLPNLVLEADVLIGVPVLKNHYLAGTTLGMKNMIGVAPNDIYHVPGHVYEKKELSHADVELHQHIVDLNLARKPDLVVVDGLRGMTDGPIGSQIIDPPMRLILAGRDVAAVDTVGTLIMGYDPSSVPYLQMAQQVGLGTIDTAWIQVIGQSVAQVRRDFPAPYGEPPVIRAESEPPLADITCPDEDCVITVSTQMLIDAVDDAEIAKVELCVDGLLVDTDREAPYQFALEPDGLGIGQHTVKVVAYDRALNQGVDTITVNVSSPQATSSVTPTSTVESTATQEPTPRPAEPTVTAPPSAPTQVFLPTPSVTNSPRPSVLSGSPESIETATVSTGHPSSTGFHGTLLCGLIALIAIVALGACASSFLAARRR